MVGGPSSSHDVVVRFLAEAAAAVSQNMKFHLLPFQRRGWAQVVGMTWRTLLIESLQQSRDWSKL
jgi:hypothetical protein